MYNLGDTVTFQVVEEDLSGKPTGPVYFETGKVEDIWEGPKGERFLKVRVLQHRYYILDEASLPEKPDGETSKV